MKRTLALILLSVSVFSLFACAGGNRSYDEAEVLSEAERLIKESAVLNEVFWGEGLEYEEEDDSIKVYFPATRAALSRLGVENVEDMLEKTLSVFSREYSESIYLSVFSGTSGGAGTAVYARYYQDNDKVMVYSRYNRLLTDEVEYLYDTLSVVGSKGEVVTVKISVKVTRDGSSQTKEKEIGLIEEADGWKIDTPTFATYH